MRERDESCVACGTRYGGLCHTEGNGSEPAARLNSGVNEHVGPYGEP